MPDTTQRRATTATMPSVHSFLHGDCMSDEQPPLFPAGEFVPPGSYDAAQKDTFIEQLKQAPQIVRESVEGLGDEQLDTAYKNWTVRQIVHHLADSHMNAFIRFKWALTEEMPLIKCYNETLWSEVVDARTTPIECSLTLLDGLHDRWAELVKNLDDDQLGRTYFHPEIGEQVSLHEALPSYVWHAQHHTAQIQWLRAKNGW